MKIYMLANIPDQYMNLDWERDFVGDDTAKEAVELYLDKWDNFKAHGMGIEFASPQMGTGKTFAVTHIGKELIKRGESVYFLPHNQMMSAMNFARPDQFLIDKMNMMKVLILDEITPPFSDKASGIFSDNLESVVRNRTNYNGVTIMTTNMTEEDWEKHYPRIYSLLRAKQMTINLKGVDFRASVIGQKNLEMVANSERSPLR